ncbi:MAG: hypothetical protein IIA89_07600 [Chloroflexi bacterium]|nr:hypothetical protein [Chloroflexota bacterium]
MVQFDGKLILAHRASYQVFNNNGEPIPPGVQIIHLCERDICIEPSHLKAVSATERALYSIERGNHPSKRYDIGPEEEEEMRDRHWIGGERYDAIAPDYDLSHETVRVICLGTRAGCSPLSRRHAKALEMYLMNPKRPPFTRNEVRQIKRRLESGESGVSIARDLNCSKTTISQIKNKKHYADVE